LRLTRRRRRRRCCAARMLRAPTVGKLYVVSDVLHNASQGAVQGASTLPLKLQPRLSHALARLALAARNSGRMSSFAAGDALRRTIEAWARWRVFSPELVRACIVAGAPCGESDSRLQLLTALNVVGAAPPEPVEGEPLEEGEELVWRREVAEGVPAAEQPPRPADQHLLPTAAHVHEEEEQARAGLGLLLH
jgi:hypothetical protein